MNHEQAKQRWHDCTDQGGADAELERHLAECASCRAYVREMETLMLVLDTARRETERIEARAACRIGPRRDRGGDPPSVRFPARLRAAAMIAVVIGLCYVALRVSSTGTAPDRSPQVVDHGVPQPDAPPPSFGLTLRGKSAGRTLVVADPISTADVQVYWLYSSLAQPGGEAETEPDGASEQQGRVDRERNHALTCVTLHNRMSHDRDSSKGNST